MSPSQRATDGADEPSPPAPTTAAALGPAWCRRPRRARRRCARRCRRAARWRRPRPRRLAAVTASSVPPSTIRQRRIRSGSLTRAATGRGAVGSTVTASPRCRSRHRAGGGRSPARRRRARRRRRCRSPTRSARPGGRSAGRAGDARPARTRRTCGAAAAPSAMNASGASDETQPSITSSSSASCTSTVPLPARKPFDERRADRRRGADRQRPRQPRADQRPVPRAAVVQQAGGAALHQAVHVAALGDDGEHRRPLGPARRMVDQRERGLHAGEPLDHRRRGVVVERAAGHHRRRRARARPARRTRRAARWHRCRARRRSAARAPAGRACRSPGRRRDRARPGPRRGRRPAARRRAGRRAGRVSSTATRSASASTAAARSSRRCVAAACTVVPWADSSMRRIVSSGSHCSRHVSRNVPLLPRPSSTEPQCTPSARSRCSSTERARPFGARTSSSTVCAVGRRLQPDPPLLRGEVASQRHLRRVVGHLADRVADDQLALDQRHAAGAGHHRVGGVEHLGEPGPRPVAQRGQRRGGAGGRDQVVGRRRHAAVAQQPRRADEPAADARLAGVGEHVGVPAGLRTPAP